VAARHLHAALELFTSIQARIDVAMALEDMAALAWRAGDSAQARTRLEQALDLWQVLDTPRWLEQSGRLAAEWGFRPREEAAQFPR
jgi:hypothetical protein